MTTVSLLHTRQALGGHLRSSMARSLQNETVRRWIGLPISLSAVLFLEVVEHLVSFEPPNPTFLPLAAVVASTYLGSLFSGFLSLIVSISFYIHYLSEPGQVGPLSSSFGAHMTEYAMTLGLAAALTDGVRRRFDLRVNAKALRASEERFRAAVENFPGVLWICDAAGSLQFVNSAGLELLGLTRDEVIGKSYASLVSEDLSSAHSQASRRVLATGRPEVVEWTAPDHLGSFTALMSIIPLTDSHGIARQVLTTAQPITERKKMEDALRASEQRLRGVLDSLPVGLLQAEASGRIVYANAAFFDMVGYSSADIESGALSWRTLTPPEHMEKSERLWKDLGATGGFHPYEKEYIAKDGKRVPVLVGASRIAMASGELGHGAAFVMDLRSLKQAQKELATSEERFRIALRRAPVIVASIDRDLRYTWVHTAIPGFVDESAVGKRVDEVLTGTDGLIITYLLQQVLQSGVAASREVRVSTPVGLRTYDMSVEPLRSEAGSIDGASIAAVDITERKRAEDELRCINETLEQRVAERAAVAEHRATQLRAMASELIHAEQRERRRLAQLLHDHLQQLLVGARFMLAAVRDRSDSPQVTKTFRQMDDLLDQAVQASRTLTVELSPPVLHEEGMRAALRWLSQQMEAKHGLSVHVEAEGDLLTSPEDVRILLFQATRELLFNVAKHAGVREAFVRLVVVPGERVSVTVSDAGKGFDPNRFHSSNLIYTGLGLFSVRERVEMIGGRLEVDSIPGRGTRITMMLPLHDVVVHSDVVAVTPRIPRANPKASVATSAGGPKIRVVLADDHRLVREGLASMLRGEPDIEVIGEAVDGQQAVELVSRLLPDAVIMDVSMPGVNGIEATRRILAASPTIRVIGLSMHEEGVRAQAMRDAGAVAYFKKDGPTSTLIAALRACTPLDTREVAADNERVSDARISISA